jgi:hypothetical protein
MEPSWQKVKLIKLVATAAPLWTLVRDYVPGSRLLRFTVVDKDESNAAVASKWCPVDKTPPCGPDGIVPTTSKSGLLTNGALYGALIGKLGGSSADVPDSSAVGSPYGTKRVFAIGSHCVISLASGDAGPLFLTMNDTPNGFGGHSGELHILLEEYPT